MAYFTVPLKSKNVGRINPLVRIIGAFSIWSLLIPIIIADIWTTIYQEIYFTIYDIPKISKKDYLNMDRWDLDKLNIWQKLSCVYCEYANGTVAWLKAVANQTEINSCAIKHKKHKLGEDHHKDFYAYEEFQSK